MVISTVAEAETQLASLVERALAGEEVWLSLEDRPAVRLVPAAERQFVEPGMMRGKIRMADDFDELPDEIAAAFGVSGP